MIAWDTSLGWDRIAYNDLLQSSSLWYPTKYVYA